MGQEGECGEDGFICPDCLKEMEEEKDAENLSNELTDKDDEPPEPPKNTGPKPKKSK